MNKRSLAAMALATLSACALADSIILNPIADLRILSFNPDGNDNGNGLSTVNAVGNEQRTLIQFDYSSLVGLNIQTATLELRGASYDGSETPIAMDLYRVIQPWIETTATWNSRDTGVAWANPGGDAVGTTGGQLTNPYYHWSGNGVNTPTWFSFDATSLVEGSVSGSNPNDGMLLDGEVGNALVYVSREGNTFGGVAGLPTEIPQLVVTYSSVPEPATCLALGTIAGATLLRRRARTAGKVS